MIYLLIIIQIFIYLFVCFFIYLSIIYLLFIYLLIYSEENTSSCEIKKK